MDDQACSIPNCNAKVYAPAGTGALCKEHFLNFLAWRRKRGIQMFKKYAAMTMEERDAVMAEWAKTVRIDEAPTPPGAKR